MARSKGSSSKFGWGFLLGLAVAAGGAVACIKYGLFPAPPSGKPPTFEKSAALPAPPANSQPVRETHVIKIAPFGISEDVFEAGARVYTRQCASCHGTPGHDVAFAKYMNPAAPQLWKKHGSVVGVTDDEAGETFWKVQNGIHQSGMPAFQHVLSETQMWQVSLLMKNADQQLPDPVMTILNGTK